MKMRDELALGAYAGYDVLDKWSTVSFDDTTRRVLQQRLAAPPPRRTFTLAELRTLDAACARLLATEPGCPPIALAIDADLFEGRREGYRHPDMPPVEVAWHRGLAGLDAEARRRHGAAFADLAGHAQNRTLHALQGGDVDASAFDGLPVRRFFVDVLLKTVVGHYYGRPDAWSEIGFGGPASPRGYVRIGLDRRDPWEAPWPRRDGGSSR